MLDCFVNSSEVGFDDGRPVEAQEVGIRLPGHHVKGAQEDAEGLRAVFLLPPFVVSGAKVLWIVPGLVQKALPGHPVF